ncbi:hypothetical protein HYU15_03785, partial [Candidatus Woesearchaeota archaeon]|nr:hypothetical protein [Candidatus Woesearchaeota archaeon]
MEQPKADAGQAEGRSEENTSGSGYRIMTVNDYEAEQAGKEKAEKERQELAAKEKIGRERAEQEKAEREKAEKERAEADARKDAPKPAHQERPAGHPAAAPQPGQVAEGGGKDNSTKYFLIIAAVVVVLTVAFFSMRALKPEQKYETVKYNGFVFERYAGLWNTQWKQDRQLYNLRLHFNPYQVENVSIIGDEGWSA